MRKAATLLSVGLLSSAAFFFVYVSGYKHGRDDVAKLTERIAVLEYRHGLLSEQVVRNMQHQQQLTVGVNKAFAAIVGAVNHLFNLMGKGTPL